MDVQRACRIATVTDLAEDPTDYDLLQLNALLSTFIRLMARWRCITA